MFKFNKYIIMAFILICGNAGIINAQDNQVNIDQIIDSSTEDADPAIEPVFIEPKPAPEGSITQLESEEGNTSPEQEKIIQDYSSNGNCQVTITNTNKRPDDVWRLSVDGKQVDIFEKGEERFWGLNLTPGRHEITVTGAFEPDTTGNYSIKFDKCNVIKGPPTENFNDCQMTVFTWFVNVDE